MKVKKKIKPKAEAKIQREILDWLFEKGYFFWRNKPNVAFVNGGFRKPGKYDVVGASDIFGVINGKFIAIEVKNAKGVLNANQKIFIDTIKEEGGIAFVARGIEDLEGELFQL